LPIDDVTQAHIDGRASEHQLALLKSDQDAWIESLWRLLDAAELALERARREVRGAERGNVLSDLDDECYRIDAVMTELLGPPPEEELTPAPPQKVAPGITRLQLSWNEGRLVAWAGGFESDLETHSQVLERLKAHGAGAIEWEEREAVKIPSSGQADIVSAPLTRTLGWLVALAQPTIDDSLGASVRWMGLVAAHAVELVAQGRMVPQLIQFKGARKSKGRGGQSTFHVRWVPALVDPAAMDALVKTCPGAAMVGQPQQDRKTFVAAVLADLTDAIVRTAADQVEVPAPPPDPKNRTDVGEAVLGRLDGSAFRAPAGYGSEIVRKLDKWAEPVTGNRKAELTVQLAPPDESNAWLASVLSAGPRGVLEPLEVALTTSSESRSKALKGQVSRLERLFPELLRPGGRRRGEVILSQDEAWRLMTDVGQILTSSGFDVRVPPLSRKKATASLRLTADEAQDTVVGARQLANVRWSAVFDDVELTAEDISRLAAEARPLVQSRGQWVEIDKADLVEAAAALAERADMNRLSGADMLRHALGLEGSPLAGGISIAGQGWAADLLRSLDSLPEEPETRPEFFEGELRSYQADALAWLLFLDEAGLGGCLALDMGLGKTPTTLASLAFSRDHGCGLVIAPPAVVGNWAAEARRFIPDVKVHVHHGANRVKGRALAKKAQDVELIITTYGTAVRDMDDLAEIYWGKVVIDEAQAIKNPGAETSVQLRRLDARTKVALTGTPIENGLGDLWSIMDWANPGLLGARAPFIAQLTPNKGTKVAAGEDALRALNGILVYRRTKIEPEIAAELPDRIDELDHCSMTPEQIGLYQAVVNSLVVDSSEVGSTQRKGAVLAAITALKQICNHPVNYQEDDKPLDGRSGKLARLNEILESVFAADEKVLIFTHFATWGERLSEYLSERTGKKIECYHGGLGRGARDRMVDEFQASEGAGAMVLSLKAGGTGLNLTAANHVVLYDRWWNPAVEDQARDRVWRIGQTKTVIAHRLVCPGTVDERVEEVVAGKRQIANMVLPKSSSVGDLDAEQLQQALGLDPELLLDSDDDDLADASSVDEAEVPA